MSNPLSAFGNLAGSLRNAGREFIELFAVEGRIASHTVIRTTVFAVMAGTFFAMAWLLLSVAAAAMLVNVYEWGWPLALCLVGGLQVLAAAALAMMARRTAAAEFFPHTLAQLHRSVSTSDGGTRSASAMGVATPLVPSAMLVAHPSAVIPGMDQPAARVPAGLPQGLQGQLQMHEQHLLAARDDIEKKVAETRSAARACLAHPAVLAAAVGVGLLLGLAGRKSYARARPHVVRPVRPSLFFAPATLRQPLLTGVLGGATAHIKRAAVAQASAYAIGALASWLQRRQHSMAASGLRPQAPQIPQPAPQPERRRQPTVLRLVHERRGTGEPN